MQVSICLTIEEIRLNCLKVSIHFKHNYWKLLLIVMFGSDLEAIPFLLISTIKCSQKLMSLISTPLPLEITRPCRGKSAKKKKLSFQPTKPTEKSMRTKAGTSATTTTVGAQYPFLDPDQP